MKGLTKIFLSAICGLSLLTSCLSEGNSMAGFSAVQHNATAYANTDRGYVSFMSYGNWRIDMKSGGDWLKLDTLRGVGMAIYTIPVRYQKNTTGAVRTANMYLYDTDESDANMTFSMSQYATRGDGSMGSAPLVKAITGDDGSTVSIDYDSNCRPTRLSIKKGELMLRSLTFVWGDTTVTVNNSLNSTINIGYQPQFLSSSTDTVQCYISSSVSYKQTYGYTFEERRNQSSEYSAAAMLFEGATLGNPDGDWEADSLRYLHHRSDGTEFRQYAKIAYNGIDNRYQSVDVNQLVFGVEECNPYLLLGMFRSARSTKIFSTATTDGGTYTLTPTLNADKSVNTLAVKDTDGNTITYTFEYHPNTLWQ